MRIKLPNLKGSGRHKGGRRVPRDGQQALLQAIVAHFGGPQKMTELIREHTGISEFHKQNLVNWRNRRGIPLELVNRVARGLNLNEYALNYKDMAIFKGEAPPWRDVVISCQFLSKETLEEILRCPDPRF